MRANQASFKDLRKNLRENGIDPIEMPLVIQYNKRDLPDIRSEEEIDAHGEHGQASRTFLATATHGNGVMETFIGLIGSDAGRTSSSEHSLRRTLRLRSRRACCTTLRERFGAAVGSAADMA